MSVDIAALIRANTERWQRMKVDPHVAPAASHVALDLVGVSAKRQYQAVEAKTKVPWPIIAVIHMRESSQSWRGNLAQGDPWNRRSTHEPAGRGPFASWEDAAVDALENCIPHAARWTDWSIGGALTLLERYNGLGYAQHGLPSPYLWAGTSQYRAGKYVADWHFDPDAVDHQIGCAALLQLMCKVDPTIKLWSPPAQAAPAPAPAPQPAPTPKGAPMGDTVKEITDAAGFVGSLFSQFSGFVGMLIPTQYKPFWQAAQIAIPAALNGIATVAHDVGIAQAGTVVAAHNTAGQPNAPALSANSPG